MRRTARPTAPYVLVDSAKHLDDAMLTLSRLSVAAQAAGDSGLMYAANRAWRELDQHRRDSAEGR